MEGCRSPVIVSRVAVSRAAGGARWASQALVAGGGAWWKNSSTITRRTCPAPRARRIHRREATAPRRTPLGDTGLDAGHPPAVTEGAIAAATWRKGGGLAPGRSAWIGSSRAAGGRMQQLPVEMARVHGSGAGAQPVGSQGPAVLRGWRHRFRCSRGNVGQDPPGAGPTGRGASCGIQADGFGPGLPGVGGSCCLGLGEELLVEAWGWG